MRQGLSCSVPMGCTVSIWPRISTPGRVSPAARLVAWTSGPTSAFSGRISTASPTARAYSAARCAMAVTPAGEFEGDSH
ncbi:Uncharacterised protein [Bordetella pertussis]|nr:Uncharacterised protein [Bordetella pertussis]